MSSSRYPPGPGYYQSSATTAGSHERESSSRRRGPNSYAAEDSIHSYSLDPMPDHHEQLTVRQSRGGHNAPHTYNSRLEHDQYTQSNATGASPHVHMGIIELVQGTNNDFLNIHNAEQLDEVELDGVIGSIASNSMNQDFLNINCSGNAHSTAMRGYLRQRSARVTGHNHRNNDQILYLDGTNDNFLNINNACMLPMLV